MKIDREARMMISVLAEWGQSGRAIARMLGVTEHAVRRHLRHQREATVDGRSRQVPKGAAVGEAIAH